MEKKQSLESLLPGQTGRILAIIGPEDMKRRLLDIGFVKNTLVTCEGSSAHGNPKAYSLRGCVIALRREDSRNILIQEVAYDSANQ